MQNRIIIISMILLIVSLVIILLISYFNSATGLPADCHIDSIVVYKSKRTMLVFANGSCLKTYKIALAKPRSVIKSLKEITKLLKVFTPSMLKIPIAVFIRIWASPTRTACTLQPRNSRVDQPAEILKSTV